MKLSIIIFFSFIKDSYQNDYFFSVTLQKHLGENLLFHSLQTLKLYKAWSFCTEITKKKHFSFLFTFAGGLGKWKK